MLRGLASAIRLLTALPLPNPQGDGVGARLLASGEHFDAGWALPFFPVAGGLVGLIAAGAFWAGSFGISPLAGAALALVAEALVTAGFHYDGLADTADGLWASHHTRERSLEIMKDSRVGAHGVVAVGCALIARCALLAALMPGQLGLIVAAAAVARLASVYAAVVAPYARATGTGASVAFQARSWYLAAAAALAAAIVYGSAGLTGLCGLVAALLAAAAITWRISRRLGGMTGDTYGATIVLTDIVALGAMLAVAHLGLL